MTAFLTLIESEQVKSRFCLLYEKYIAMVIAICSCTTAYAADTNIGVTANPTYLSDDGMQLYGTSEPKNEWNLATKGKYEFKGSANYDNLYSNYYFTGVSREKIVVYNYRSSTLTVTVLKKGIFNTTVQTNQVAGNTTSNPAVFYVNLDSSKKYILNFDAPSNFSGYIQKA